MSIPSHRRIRAVAFDFDGTLTRPGALDFPAVKRELGCPVDRPVLEFIEAMADADLKEAAFSSLDRFETEAAALSEPAPGAGELVGFLKARGIAMAVLTRNSRTSVLRALENFHDVSAADFRTIITRDDPAAPKPSPEGVLLAARRLGVPPEEILVVGDFVFDIQAGRAAGALTAWVVPDGADSVDGAPGSDVAVTGLGDLEKIIDRHLPLGAGKFPASLLEAFFGKLSLPDPSVLIASAVGEDTAAIDVDGEEVLILKSDPITFATDAIGDYAVVVNANDIATSGAVPRWLLATILFPVGITPAGSLEVMENLRRVCERRGITLCGGHTEITDAVTRTVVIGMMAGTVSRSRLIDKSAMGPGDRVLLTKAVAVEGSAIIAREFAERLRQKGLEEDKIETCKALLSNLSILEEARIAADAGGVTGMHDVTEGGIATALEELSAAAGHRIRVERDRIPVLDSCRRICRVFHLDPLGLIGSGSLLICCREDAAGTVTKALETAGIAVTEIGQVAGPGRGIDAFSKAKPVAWPRFAVDEIARLFSSGQ